MQADANITKIKNIFYSVKFFHNTLHLSDPTQNVLATEMLEAGKRLCRKTIKKKNPLKTEHIKAIYSKFTANGPMNLQDLRTFTMIVLGFCGFLRYAELSAILFGDIRFCGTYIKIFIEESKTDIYRDGKWVTISASGKQTCPVKNLTTYLERTKITEEGDLFKFIFRGISKSKKSEKLKRKNKPLSYTRTREIVMKTIKSIGLNEKSYCTHSLRSGGATLAANAGVPDRLFKRHGRWLSDKAKDMYVEDNLEELLSVTKLMGI